MASLRLILVKILFYPLWLLDYLEISFFGFFRYLTYIIVLFISVQLVIPGSLINRNYQSLLKDATYFNDGIIATFYAPSSAQSTNILGTASKRQLPFIVKELNVPEVTAKSALVVDLKYDKALFSLNDHLKLAPASTTKLMTALVALGIYNLDDELTVPEYCTTIDSTRAGFAKDDVVKVKDLLYSLLVASAGDSACVLSTSKLKYDEFISKMNDKAKSINMKDTNFSNPIGLDGVDGEHYSTAYDLRLLAKQAIKNSIIRDIVKTTQYTINSDKLKHAITLQNTNKLLGEIPGTVGIKTGRTAEAGEVLIYEYADKVRDIMIVVMGSQNRFEDTKELLNWTLASYSWE